MGTSPHENSSAAVTGSLGASETHVPGAGASTNAALKTEVRSDAKPGANPAVAADALSPDTLGIMAAEPTPGTTSVEAAKLRVKWYRCKVSREELSKLNQRSDLLGFLQTVGFLGLLAMTAGLAIYSWRHWPWYVTAGLVVLNGHLWHFLVNGFHELIHDSVFKTKWLNQIFLRIVAFLGWHNHHWFWASHTEHHKYTLHPPDDLEVTVPQHYQIRSLLLYGIVNVKQPYEQVSEYLKTALWQFEKNDRWTNQLFPESEPERRRDYVRWSQIVLIGHLSIAAVSLALGWWIVPLVITFPKIFGNWLHILCNSSQHAGLPDNVADFRLCCRTLYLNPVLQFVYWHMNYHTEHHMFAAVPCYRLGRLHRIIKADMPECPRGLWATWHQIFEIQRKQEADSGYRYYAPLPEKVLVG